MVQICVKNDFEETKMCKYASILKIIVCRFSLYPESHRGIVTAIETWNYYINEKSPDRSRSYDRGTV